VKLICDLLIGQHLSRLNRLHFLKCGWLLIQDLNSSLGIPHRFDATFWCWARSTNIWEGIGIQQNLP
jgi:hypothetical protein